MLKKKKEKEGDVFSAYLIKHNIDYITFWNWNFNERNTGKNGCEKIQANGETAKLSLKFHSAYVKYGLLI